MASNDDPLHLRQVVDGVKKQAPTPEGKTSAASALGGLICIGGLLFNLLLILALSLILVYQGLNMGIHYSFLLIHLVGAAIIATVFFGVGKFLNRDFDSAVSRFIQGAMPSPRGSPFLLKVYGLLLIALLPFLFYLLFVAALAAIDFGFYSLMLISQLPRVPIWLLIAPFVVALGSLIGIAMGIFQIVMPPSHKTAGLKLEPDQQPELWELTREVAKQLTTRPIDEIILTASSGIGVYLRGSILATVLGGGKRVLELSLTDLHGLSYDELRAILGHEYGHFNNADTQWTTFTFAMGSCLQNALQTMPGPNSNDKEGGGLRLVMSLNPAFWLLFVYMLLYRSITSGFSRIREVMADLVAIDKFGGANLANGLFRVSVNSTLFSEVIFNGFVIDALKEGKVITNFSTIMAAASESSKLADFEKQVRDQGSVASSYDSHPPLTTRIAYMQKLAGEHPTTGKSAKELFSNWDELNNTVADIYNNDLLRLVRGAASK